MLFGMFAVDPNSSFNSGAINRAIPQAKWRIQMDESALQKFIKKHDCLFYLFGYQWNNVVWRNQGLDKI